MQIYKNSSKFFRSPAHLVRIPPYLPQVAGLAWVPGALEAVSAPGGADGRGTWGAEGRLRTRWGRLEGYLGRWRPFPHQVGPTGGVPGALRAIFAPGDGWWGATRRGKAGKPLRVGHFLTYPSRKTCKTSTGRAFFGLPVEEKPGNLYGSGERRVAGRRVAHNSAAMVPAGCGELAGDMHPKS